LGLLSIFVAAIFFDKMWTKDNIFDMDTPTIFSKLSCRRYSSNENSELLRDFGYKALRESTLLDTAPVSLFYSLARTERISWPEIGLCSLGKR